MYIEKLPNGKFKCVQRYKDYLTGKIKRVSVTIDKDTPSKRKEAQRLIDEKISNLNKYSNKKEYTISEIVEFYRNYQKVYVKAVTYKRNFYAENTILSILGSDIIANNLTATFVREKLIDSGKTGGSLNELMSRIKALFRWAYKEELINDIRWLEQMQVFPDVSRRNKISDKFLESNELKFLLSKMDVEYNKQFYIFIALSGLRPGEAIAITNTDIDIVNRVISVNKTFDPLNKIITSTKTETSEREVYLQNELLEFIKNKLNYNKQLQISTGIRSDLLFFNLKGERLNYFALNKYFKENCMKYLNKTLTLHSLRHTHASLMFEQGMSLEAISERLGHSNSAITKEVYLHITNKMKDKYNSEIKDIHIL